MADVVDCKGGFDVVFGVTEGEDLQAGVEDEGFDGWMALFCVFGGEETDFGQRG